LLVAGQVRKSLAVSGRNCHDYAQFASRRMPGYVPVHHESLLGVLTIRWSRRGGQPPYHGQSYALAAPQLKLRRYADNSRR
jgi:hypothetical protein